MTCASSDGRLEWTDQNPISVNQWKSLLSKLTNEETTKQISSTSNPHNRSPSRLYSSSRKKQDRQSLPRNQVFGDAVVDSFLVSTSSNLPRAATGISRQDVPQIISSPTKRYVSSFKTLVNSTSSKHSQQLSYVKDNVIIFKLSKDDTPENTDQMSNLSSKHSTVSVITSTTPPPKQSSSSSTTFSPIFRVEGQKRRIAHSDSSIISSNNIDSGTSYHSAHTMAMSATSHPSSNLSLYAYRNTVTAGSTVRQRVSAETNTNSLLITSERFKSNISSSMRPARQPVTTTIPSTYMSSQQPQRNINHGTRSRTQQDKLTNSKDLYGYPDPFTNCPHDILSKLAQLTKLQLETIEWEKKRRFTKKKPVTNNTTHGKDSP